MQSSELFIRTNLKWPPQWPSKNGLFCQFRYIFFLSLSLPSVPRSSGGYAGGVGQLQYHCKRAEAAV